MWCLLSTHTDPENNEMHTSDVRHGYAGHLASSGISLTMKLANK